MGGGKTGRGDEQNEQHRRPALQLTVRASRQVCEGDMRVRGRGRGVRPPGGWPWAARASLCWRWPSLLYMWKGAVCHASRGGEEGRWAKRGQQERRDIGTPAGDQHNRKEKGRARKATHVQERHCLAGWVRESKPRAHSHCTACPARHAVVQ